jgi:carbonic anhydrase/acetyltransferase-like protein (isoleucine patch superfamily)
MATPSQMQKIEWDQPYYSIYRYPWMAEFAGAMPQGFEADADAKHAGMHHHKNGGGLVSDSTVVAERVYVGPYARVLGGRVTGNARIEDHAVILNGSVSDNARIGGLSVIDRGVKISGDAVVKTTFMGIGAFEPGVEVSGTAQVLGDAEIRNGVKLSKGSYYGFVDPEVLADPKQGSERVGPVPEVTAKPDFSWIP